MGEDEYDSFMQVLSYSIKGAAAAIGVSTWTIWQLVKTGDLTTFKLGARTLIRADVLEGFIDRRSRPNPASEPVAC